MSEERKIEITGPHEIPGGGWSIHVSIDRRIDKIQAIEFNTYEEAFSRIDRLAEIFSKDPSSFLR